MKKSCIKKWYKTMKIIILKWYINDIKKWKKMKKNDKKR